ncbi:MAG: trehalose-phosphatase [Desulfohalobiaceae bacterium]
MAGKQYGISRSEYQACIFDLDGVVTTTARLHAESWKELFDEFLCEKYGEQGFTPFSIETDYRDYVDGMPRYQGVKSFLDSRGISLPYGNVDDSPEAETVCGLGNHKNRIFNQSLQQKGVDVYETSVDLIHQLRSRTFRIAVVSSSKNCQTVLDAANIGHLFDVRVDGIDIEHNDLKGKPEPDSFEEAARLLDVSPSRSVLFEDAISGVQAGRKGNFGMVVGVDRTGVEGQLREAGADIVVKDLGEIDLRDDVQRLPHGLIFFEEIRKRFEDKRVAVFLDYDGTLTPIVSRPEDAILSQDMRNILHSLTEKCTVAIISGRGLADARQLVDVKGVYFAGSHGFEIEGPGGVHMEVEEARESLPALDQAESDLNSELAEIDGAQVERKKFSIAVHYRNVDQDRVPEVEACVDRVLERAKGLRKGAGKKVFELAPDIPWHKGWAVRWLLRELELDQYGVVPIYIGDDVTDENAFHALSKRGITLVVANESRPTEAKYRLESVGEVRDFLSMLYAYLRNWRTWSLDYDEYVPELEGLRESLCTLGNGYFATRGAAPEAKADAIHYPGTYLAGGYNRLQTEMGGRIIENEDLVNMPNWLGLTFRFPGEEWFNVDEMELVSYRKGVDLKNGVFYRSLHVRDRAGRETRIYHRRIVCMHSMHMAALETGIVPVNWSGDLEIRSSLDGQVDNSGVKRYQKLNNKHLEPVCTSEIDERTIGLQVQTNQSKLAVAQAARTEVFQQRKPLRVQRECRRESGYIAHDFRVELAENQGVRVEKIVSMYTSRDPAISEPFLEASEAVRSSGRLISLLRSHTQTWKHLWRRFGMEVELKVNGSPGEGGSAFDHYHYVQRTLHLYCFHLLQSASMHSLDIDVGMPARGWHGEAYRGHIFWDEIIIFPYLNFRAPQITRTLLMYRYRRLSTARQMAYDLGYKGAMFPWQSGSNGREETQSMHLNPNSGRWLPDKSHLQRHINVAIVYNIWQYCQISGDFEFLSFYGAEMILEIARFWSSITAYNEELDRFEIHGVMGPDEFHDGYPDADRPGLSNNAYTNIMVVFVMNQALELPHILPRQEWEQLCERLDVRKAEIDRWREISRKMRVVFHDGEIISQFEGYDQLQEFDWQGYMEKYEDIQRLDRILEAEEDTCNRYKASKQADTLMLFYLFSAEYLQELFHQLGYELKPGDIPKNIDYYLERTSNGSSLSYVAHSWVSARRDRRHSWRLFEEALKTDVEDVQGGTTPEGIHLGAMAGCVDIVQRCFTGLEARGNVLRFNPQFPEELDRVKFHLRYRGHWIELDIDTDKVQIEALESGAEPVSVQIRDAVYELEQGKTIEYTLS